jgi:hypothetical protein
MGSLFWQYLAAIAAFTSHIGESKDIFTMATV